MNATNDAQRYLTGSEVCEVLRISRSRLSRLLAGGKLRGVRRGGSGHWIVRQDWLDAFLAADLPPAQEEAAKRDGDAAAARKLRAIGYRI